MKGGRPCRSCRRECSVAGSGARSGYVERLLMGLRVEAMERELRTLRDKKDRGELRARAAERMSLGLSLDREEAAEILGVSTKKLQRMEAAGTLRRCPNMGTVVRYAARDVLGLASASSRKGA